MRLTPVLVAGGLMAVALLPSAARADDVAARPAASRVGLVSVTAEAQGALPGRPGNWHTVVISINGSDGVSGVVADWTCADGVEPNYADVGAEWTCTPESYGTVAAATDEDGASLVRVAVNRPTRHLVARGLVAVTDDSGVSAMVRLRLQAVADGGWTRTVGTAPDGSRTVTITRTGTRARGAVGDTAFRPKDWQISASDLVSVTTLASAGRVLTY
ncbi:MAG: hypothetical protein U0R78_08775 [Nocardioidaceae bacterium]